MNFTTDVVQGGTCPAQKYWDGKYVLLKCSSTDGTVNTVSF